MNDPLILVTGATGKTGLPTVHQLRTLGYPVRAFVHQEDARTEALKALGADIMVGDFHDLSTLRNAMRSVKRVYFCYPPADRLVEATTNIAIAANEEGVDGLVNMSQISARESARSQLAYQHWQAEHILDWAEIGASHIRPTFFAEDLYLFTGGRIATDGTMALPFGDAKHAPVAAADIARVVVGILRDPVPHIGERYVVTGPHNMTLAEMADVLSDVLGKTVGYVPISIEEWHQALIKHAHFPEFLAAHLAAVAKDHQEDVFSAQTDIVRALGGQPPMTLADFVRENLSAFQVPR